MKVIAYSLNNEVVILYPTSSLPIEEAARKDVPHGAPYKILDISELPKNDLFRNAWELSVDQPDGYGADYGYGGKYQVVGYTANYEPIVKARL
jgi:hypothetical protein